MATHIPPPEPEKVDYMDLPLSLKPEHFEGLRFDFTKGLNQKFSLSHSIVMGPTEVPSQSAETIKIPTANYEFGANFIDPKVMLFGRILTDGRPKC
ncbi:putative eukaryotic porin/Tom40 [Helianthus annuus]|nr:putative eukaryotic porin/Tom40 [Helianthus annuus]